ncbi:class I lanthipeptide [Pontimicrobium sp. MEBiC01747]|jgi:hypothetical protein
MKTRGTKKKLHFKKSAIVELNDSTLYSINGGLIMNNNPVLDPGNNGSVIINTSLLRPFTNNDRPTSGALCKNTGMVI